MLTDKRLIVFIFAILLLACVSVSAGDDCKWYNPLTWPDCLSEDDIIKHGPNYNNKKSNNGNHYGWYKHCEKYKKNFGKDKLKNFKYSDVCFYDPTNITIDDGEFIYEIKYVDAGPGVIKQQFWFNYTKTTDVYFHVETEVEITSNNYYWDGGKYNNITKYNNLIAEGITDTRAQYILFDGQKYDWRDVYEQDNFYVYMNDSKVILGFDVNVLANSTLMVDPTFSGDNCTHIQANLTAGYNITFTGTVGDATTACYLDVDGGDGLVIDGQGNTLFGGFKIFNDSITIKNINISDGYDCGTSRDAVCVDGIRQDFTFFNITIVEINSPDAGAGYAGRGCVVCGATEVEGINNSLIYDINITGDIEGGSGAGAYSIVFQGLDNNVIYDIEMGDISGEGGVADPTGEVRLFYFNDYNIIENISAYDISTSNADATHDGGDAYFMYLNNSNNVTNVYIHNLVTGNGGANQGDGGDSYGIFMNNNNSIYLFDITYIDSGNGGSSAAGDGGDLYGIRFNDDNIINNFFIDDAYSGGGGSNTGGCAGSQDVGVGGTGVLISGSGSGNQILNTKVVGLTGGGNGVVAGGAASCNCLPKATPSQYGASAGSSATFNNVSVDNIKGVKGCKSENQLGGVGGNGYGIVVGSDSTIINSNVTDIDGGAEGSCQGACGSQVDGSSFGMSVGSDSTYYLNYIRAIGLDYPTEPWHAVSPDIIGNILPEVPTTVLTTNYTIQFYRSYLLTETFNIFFGGVADPSDVLINTYAPATYCDNVLCEVEWVANKTFGTTYLFANSTTISSRNDTSDSYLQFTNPFIRTVRWDPIPAYTNTNLSGYCNATDPNGDDIIYNWNVTKNGATFSSGVTTNYTEGIEINVVNVTHINFTRNDNLTLNCMAGDGVYNSSWDSSTIEISNSIPTWIKNISDTTTNENSPVQTYLSNLTSYTFDEDGDTIIYSIVNENESEVNCSVAGNENLTLEPATDWTGNATCIIGINDSQNEGQNMTFGITVFPIIKQLYITPTYPDDDEDLVCNFEFETWDNQSANVSITWYKSLDNVSFANINTYDTTFFDVASSVLTSTGIGTGTVIEKLGNYTNWKCEATAVNPSLDKSLNSTQVNVYPMENLTIYWPPDNTTTDAALDVNFSVVDDDNIINCSLNVTGNISGTGIINKLVSNITGVGSRVPTILPWTPVYDGEYNWSMFCVGPGTSDYVESAVRSFGYSASPPTFSDFADNSITNIFPEVGDIINLNVTVSDSIGADLCRLEVNESGTFVGRGNYSLGGSKSTILQMNYTISNIFAKPNNVVGWRVWCNNSVSLGANSTNQHFNVTDISAPLVILNTGNSFDATNRSIVPIYLENVTVNVTFIDNNLFQAMINISCDINGSIYAWSDLNITSNNVTNTANIDVSKYPLQKCTAQIQASDDHTAEEIPKYKTKKIDKGLSFKTENEVNVDIVSKDELKWFGGRKTKKLKDRQTFEFDYPDKSLSRTFTLKSDHKIYTRQDSGYPAHFVVWNEETKSGNWIDFAEYSKNLDYEINKISDYEYEITVDAQIPITDKDLSNDILLDRYGLEEFDFESIGGTNIFNATYFFYLGGVVNMTSFNRYDNGTFSNYTIVVQNIDTPINITDTIVANESEFYVFNLTNGTYQFTVTHPRYFTQIYNVSINGSLVDLTYDSFQSAVYVIARNVKTGVLLDNAVVVVKNSDSGQINAESSGAGVINTFYLNATTYSLNASRNSYDTHYNNYTFSYQQNITLYIDMSFIANFTLYDERTLGLFNISSADRINFLLFCPDETYTTIINETSTSIPINCNYTKFKFVLDYGTTSYYRTFILDPDDALQVKVYLINLLTTQSIYNGLLIDDLLGDYDNPRIYVYKVIGNETVQITADWVDIENKIGAYLIENHEYIIEVHSDNQPILELGNYAADQTGDKNLRLWNVQIQPDPSSNYRNDVAHGAGNRHINGTDYFYATYADSANATDAITFTIYRDALGGPVLYTQTLINTSEVDWLIDASVYENLTIYSLMTINRDGVVNEIPKQHQDPTVLLINVLDTVDQEFMNWFLLIVLSLVAIMGTIETANVLSLVVLGMASVFIIFGWMQLSMAIIAVAAIISIMSLFKKGEKQLQ